MYSENVALLSIMCRGWNDFERGHTGRGEGGKVQVEGTSGREPGVMRAGGLVYNKKCFSDRARSLGRDGAGQDKGRDAGR